MLDGLGSTISKTRSSIYSLIAAILHLGNINFEDNGASVAKIHEEDGSQRSLEHAAELLAVTSMQLQTVLLEREIMKKNQEDRTM